MDKIIGCSWHMNQKFIYTFAISTIKRKNNYFCMLSVFMQQFSLKVNIEWNPSILIMLIGMMMLVNGVEVAEVKWIKHMEPAKIQEIYKHELLLYTELKIR